MFNQDFIFPSRTWLILQPTHTLDGFGALWIELECSLERGRSKLVLLHLLVDTSQTDVRINVATFEPDRLLVVLHCMVVLFQITVSRRQVKVALCGLVVQSESVVVGLDRLFELAEHVECISEVVISWSILGVEFNGLFVCLHSIIII